MDASPNSRLSREAEPEHLACSWPERLSSSGASVLFSWGRKETTIEDYEGIQSRCRLGARRTTLAPPMTLALYAEPERIQPRQ
ncbi:MAG: hypothetical protein QOH41_71 [Blastocatellia bacterium]|jgi:hypothetical protein|nr:hypothetical protein [Blastocatellia bacterium]